MLFSKECGHDFRFCESLERIGVASDVRPAVEAGLPLATTRAGSPLISFRCELDRVDLPEECVDPRAGCARDGLVNHGLRATVE